MSVSSQSGVFGFKRQDAVGTAASGPYTAGSSNAVNEVQKITVTATGGTFTVSFGGYTTGNQAYDVSALSLQSALAGLASIGSGNVAVTSAAGVYTVTFQGALAGQNVAQMTVNDALATGGDVTVATFTEGSAATGGWYWVPALNVAFQPNQMVNTIPPEVGGSLWARGSYKGGVYGGGQVTMVPRGGLGLAELLYAFCGGDLSEMREDLGGGVYKYTFTPEGTPGSILPWYTFIRNVGGKFVEEFQDGHLGSFGFDLNATNILQIDASFTSKSCRNIAKGSGVDSVGAQVAGNGLPFQMVDAVVRLDANNAGSPDDPIENVDYNPTRLNIAFNNELTQNEFVVGSFFLQDITNIARSAQITYNLYLRDAEIYNRVYNHGYAAADGSTGAEWSSEVWKGALEVDLLGGPIGATGDNYEINISIPEMDYMAAPISLAGNNVVEYQLSANVVLSQTPGVAPFTIEYTTDEDIV